MRRWDTLFVALDRSSTMSIDRSLKVRSVNDEEKENWRFSEDIDPMIYCVERGQEGWELVSIVEGWRGHQFMSERHFTLMLVFKRPLD